MADWTNVKGKKKGDVKLYAISTCGWCRRTKKLLNEMGVAYDYIDIDTLEGDERSKIHDEVQRWNPGVTFPTIVINNAACIVGFKEDEIKKELDI